VRFPGSRTERAETVVMVRQQQHAHIWLETNNTLLGILHVMLRDSKAAKEPALMSRQLQR
jgi:hypothetical protein